MIREEIIGDCRKRSDGSTAIYALCEQDHSPRYVGKTDYYLHVRHKAHISASRRPIGARLMVKWVEIGDCKLALGDCRDILPTLGPVDHVITDPPYGNRTHARHDASSERRRDGAEARSLGYAALSEGEAVDLADLLCKTSLGWVVWFTDSDLAGPIRDAMDGQGRCTFAPLPYHHPGRSVRLAGDGPSSWTDWIVVSRTVALKKWGTLPGGYVAGPGWNDKERMGGKPAVLMDLVVGDYSRQRETICDPFMGAGTTGVACARANRAFVGIEIDAASFDIACRRIEEAYRQPRLFSEPVPKAVQTALDLGGAA